MRQDNLADYGLPAAASPVGPLTPGAVLAAMPSIRRTTTAAPTSTTTRSSQDSVTVRVEHDLAAASPVRNQTRYNTAERTAVITSIANAAAYNPVTNLVTLSRQANERHNDIFSNQTSLVARPTTGPIRHDLSIGLEVTREEQSAPTLGGVGTRAPVDLNNPDVFSPVVGMAIAPTGATSEGSTDTVALYAFDGFDAGPRVRLNGGIRVERYSTKSHAVAAPPAVRSPTSKATAPSSAARPASSSGSTISGTSMRPTAPR